MAGIFISYRREDSAGYVALLYRDLSASFGRDRVFMDIHTLQPGQDFVASLEEAVGECAVLLAVIGPHWVTATDEDGNRRLNKPNDYVALEIGSALARSDILVIPVRVGKAQRPSPGDLPEPLLALARRQDFELTDKRWDYDVETLIKRLETVVTPVEPKAPPQQSAEGESTEAVDYRVWLEPERTHGSGAERVGLVIENLSPRSMTFAIAPRRKDARLDVRVEAEQVQIGAQSKITVGVELTPRLEEDLPPALLTGDPQTLTYAVNVGPSDAPAAARDFTGEYLLMPAVVALRLAKQEVLSPGAATFALQIRNPGSQPIVVALEAEDFTGQCHFTFDRQELTIDPQVVELVTLTVTPPQQHASDASWAFDVRARPTSPAGHPVTVQGSLVFAPERFAVRLPQPEIEASGTGTFTVEVENLGATEIAVEMRAADAAGVCTYEFDQPSAVLAPGSITQFDLRVTPPRDHPPDARWAFDVLVSPPHGLGRGH